MQAALEGLRRVRARSAQLAAGEPQAGDAFRGEADGLAQASGRLPIC